MRYICVLIYVYIHTHIYTCNYFCIYLCVCIYLHTQTQIIIKAKFILILWFQSKPSWFSRLPVSIFVNTFSGNENFGSCYPSIFTYWLNLPATPAVSSAHHLHIPPLYPCVSPLPALHPCLCTASSTLAPSCDDERAVLSSPCWEGE